MDPFFSVCIPAYNRAHLLPELLDSIISQDFTDYEIVICEDKSPERPAIRTVIDGYHRRLPDKIRYHENSENLGYDGNFRTLVEKSRGRYCFFMGNDDLMCPNALNTVAAALQRYKNVGAILRTYAAFVDSPENTGQVFRYFDEERFFPAGADTIAAIYRRFVVISGLVLHRESALNCATDRFDGTLLYQLHLVAHILSRKNALFLPQIIALWRKGGTPDFGHSTAEQGKFTPNQQTPASSLHFMQGMLDIARCAEQDTGMPIYLPIVKDIANYAYPVLSIQAGKGKGIFLGYAYRLAKMGFWRSPLFFVYAAMILMLGTRRMDRLIGRVKEKLGSTPTIGRVYKGEPT